MVVLITFCIGARKEMFTPCLFLVQYPAQQLSKKEETNQFMKEWVLEQFLVTFSNMDVTRFLIISYHIKLSSDRHNTIIIFHLPNCMNRCNSLDGEEGDETLLAVAVVVAGAYKIVSYISVTW